MAGSHDWYIRGECALAFPAWSDPVPLNTVSSHIFAETLYLVSVKKKYTCEISSFIKLTKFYKVG